MPTNAAIASATGGLATAIIGPNGAGKTTLGPSQNVVLLKLSWAWLR
jgi:ABC-type Mn2+/Zn2+ transport system ATPase subunit